MNMDRTCRTHERYVVLRCEMSTGNILLPVTPIQGVVALFFYNNRDFTHWLLESFTGNGCQKLSVKPLACSLWLHMSFKHCDVGLDRKWSSSFLRATRSERRSKIMQINGEKGGEIGVERRKRMTVEVLLCFELLFQWNGNSWLVGCLSICQWQKHLSPKRVQFSLPLQLS